jgi:hypothetical protein
MRNQLIFKEIQLIGLHFRRIYCLINLKLNKWQKINSLSPLEINGE